MSSYFSSSLFRLARPISKSLPTMRSMLMNTCMILPMNGNGPCMSHVTLVASPCGSIVNSAVLWPSNGMKKSSFDDDFRRRRAVQDFHPAGADILVALPRIDGALAAGRAAIVALHRGILVFVR